MPDSKCRETPASHMLQLFVYRRKRWRTARLFVAQAWLKFKNCRGAYQTITLHWTRRLTRQPARLKLIRTRRSAAEMKAYQSNARHQRQREALSAACRHHATPDSSE